MKTTRDRLMWIAAAVLMLTGGALLFSQNAPRHGGRWMPGAGQAQMGDFNMAEYLQLTDAQKAQMKARWQAENSAMQPLLQQLADSRKQMTAATAKGAFDQARVAMIANQQSQAMAQLIIEREKTQAQIYNQVLTSEQRAKMDDLRQ